jgi:guanylate kinase
MQHKAIIVSAPSGAGKTTIVKHLITTFPELEFSISACSREKRECESDGKDYYFIPIEEFRKKIKNNEFVEWQEVYPGSYYGTLKSELERIWSNNKVPIFDVDVYGGLNLKKYFGDNALAIFIQPPSISVLEDRLRNRGSENEENLKKRLSKAEQELSVAACFDKIVINDTLSSANDQVTITMISFLNSNPPK